MFTPGQRGGELQTIRGPQRMCVEQLQRHFTNLVAREDFLPRLA